jgi:hypothetical protein
VVVLVEIAALLKLVEVEVVEEEAVEAVEVEAELDDSMVTWPLTTPTRRPWPASQQAVAISWPLLRSQ